MLSQISNRLTEIRLKLNLSLIHQHQLTTNSSTQKVSLQLAKPSSLLGYLF